MNKQDQKQKAENLGTKLEDTKVSSISLLLFFFQTEFSILVSCGGERGEVSQVNDFPRISTHRMAFRCRIIQL